MRVVFVGSPPFATPIVERLADSPFRPVLVVTPPGRPRGRGKKVGPQPLADRARELGLEVSQPETVRAPEFLDELRALAPDCLLVASYGEFLRRELLGLARMEALNVHPSLLPRWRGATPVPAALLAGDEITGVTIQRIAMELDAGDVLVADETRIEADETAGELLERLAVMSSELCVRALRLLDEGKAEFTPQDPAGVTMCKKLTKEDGVLDWTRPAVDLERQVRALNPWPGATTRLASGKDLRVHRARAFALEGPDGEAAPGTIVDGPEELCVATGEGALALLEVQAAGKKAMDGGAFRRGARLESGTVLIAEAG